MANLKNIYIAPYLRPELVWLNIAEQPIEDIITKFAEMSLLFIDGSPQHKAKISREIVHETMGRHELGTLAIGDGIAFLYPDNYSKWTQNPSAQSIFGIGIAPKGLYWRSSEEPEKNMSLDELPVKIVFYALSPNGGAHLLTMARMSRILKDTVTRFQLISCKTQQEVISVLRFWELGNPDVMQLFLNARKKLENGKSLKATKLQLVSILYENQAEIREKLKSPNVKDRARALFSLLNADYRGLIKESNPQHWIWEVLEHAELSRVSFDIASAILISFKGKYASALLRIYCNRSFGKGSCDVLSGIERALHKFGFLKGAATEKLESRIERLSRNELLPFDISVPKSTRG